MAAAVQESSLKGLHFLGLHPQKRSKVSSIIYNASLSVVSVVMFVLAVLYGMYNGSTTFIDDIASATETATACMQLLVKVFVLISNRRLLQEVLKGKKYFWKMENESDTTIKRVRKLDAYVVNVAKAYYALMVISVIAFIFNNFIQKTFMFPNYNPKKYFLHYTTIAIMQYYFLVGVITVVFGFDFFYVSTCMELAKQIRILNDRITNILHAENVDEQIKKCAKQHVILMELMKTMICIYSAYFGWQYFVALFTIGIQIYNSSQDSGNVEKALKSVMYLVTALVQLGGFYCFPAEEVHTEMLEISNAIYNSPWLTADVHVRKQLLFMLMTSQKEYYFTAGGLIDINRAMFTNVFRASMSMVTFLQTFKTD